MGFLVLVLFFGAIAVVLLISKKQGNRVSNSTSIEHISNKEPKVARAKQLWRQANHLYQTSQVKDAANLFRESAQMLESFNNNYPNNLELNFCLLESYEGFDRDKAINYGYKCLKILKQLSERNYAVVIGTDFDVNRKLYKLLINRNRIEEAKDCLRKVVKLSGFMVESTKRSSNKELLRQLCIEGLIATHMLRGLLDGRDMKINLVNGFDTPEIWYYFDRRNGLQDSEILDQLDSMRM